jgi:hypothetical protein
LLQDSQRGGATQAGPRFDQSAAICQDRRGRTVVSDANQLERIARLLEEIHENQRTQLEHQAVFSLRVGLCGN